MIPGKSYDKIKHILHTELPWKGGGQGKGDRLGHEASPGEALLITSAYHASRDASPSFTSSP